MKALLDPYPESLSTIQPVGAMEPRGDEGALAVGCLQLQDFELLFCHGTACVVAEDADLIIQLQQSSDLSTVSNKAIEAQILWLNPEQ